MRVAEVMERGFQSIDAGASLRHAAMLMRRLDRDALPVHRGGRLVGIISRQEIARRAAEPGFEAGRVEVAEAMCREFRCCSVHQAGAEVAQQLGIAPVVPVVVTDEQGHPVGLLGEEALLRLLPQA